MIEFHKSPALHWVSFALNRMAAMKVLVIEDDDGVFTGHALFDEDADEGVTDLKDGTLTLKSDHSKWVYKNGKKSQE